ncbi:glycosyltransferase family 4 protein [Marivita geojedonensis]|uniref:glycosyltransferase family 4 protein n=1 Tax=Marivita geojedonensis TaxID=1123756 RepID=UPI000D431596|nr:glycosyltransferase family 1 protein [Marivita geojedonensis]PRY73895.1 glycosyltransferase involved in cell wall biosynthesis [Marivita geojedonensis]
MTDEVRLFFDVSSLLNHIRHARHYTGIQRVVSMLVSEISEIHSPSNVYVSYYDRKDRNHKCLSLEDLTADVLKSPTRLQSVFFEDRSVHTSNTVLKRYEHNSIKKAFYKIQFDFFAKMGKNRKFKRFGITAADWIKIRENEKNSSVNKKLNSMPALEVMKPGDKLVLLDSTWNERYFAFFKDARNMGCHVYTLVHDLIPIITPETTPGFVPLDFKNWLTGSLDFTDSYLAVSDATRKDLELFLDQFDEDREIEVIRLAQAQFADEPRTETPPSPRTYTELKAPHDRLKKLSDVGPIIHLPDATREALGSPFVLCVGTIEPRKNVWRLALAWKSLIDQGHVDLPRLVIAGKESVMVQSLKDLLNATGNVYGYVSVLDSPSEDALRRLYENCLFLAMPSLFEGWGLPVGEALSFGKTAVVSNTSSLPEVGENLVEYCDPESVKSIADAIMRLVGDSDHRANLEARIRETELRSWHTVAKELHDIVVSENSAKPRLASSPMMHPAS